MDILKIGVGVGVVAAGAYLAARCCRKEESLPPYVEENYIDYTGTRPLSSFDPDLYNEAMGIPPQKGNQQAAPVVVPAATLPQDRWKNLRQVPASSQPSAAGKAFQSVYPTLAPKGVSRPEETYRSMYPTLGPKLSRQQEEQRPSPVSQRPSVKEAPVPSAPHYQNYNGGVSEADAIAIAKAMSS